MRFAPLASEAFILVEETLSIVHQLIQFAKREIIHTGSLSLGKVSKKNEFIWDFVPNYG